MKVFQKKINPLDFLQEEFAETPTQLSLVFGLSSDLDESLHKSLGSKLNSDHIVYCSTSGHFLSSTVQDAQIIVNQYSFERTSIKCTSCNICDFRTEKEIGKYLVSQSMKDDLTHLMIFADGHIVNSDLLMEGINEFTSNTSITVSGGIAGDGVNFNQTKVGCDGAPREGEIVCIAFYGESFKVKSQICSGFQIFGPRRIVTDSELNVLKTLDGEPALDLYKRYLGELAHELPGSALHFPLAIFNQEDDPTIRTILDVNEEDKTMTFAGNIPKGATVSLMRSNIDVLLDRVEDVFEETETFDPEHIFITSCVGRRIIMDARINEELYIFEEEYPKIPITGFYSYGEICSKDGEAQAILHNQTIVVTYMAEN